MTILRNTVAPLMLARGGMYRVWIGSGPTLPTRPEVLRLKPQPEYVMYE